MRWLCKTLWAAGSTAVLLGIFIAVLLGTSSVGCFAQTMSKRASGVGRRSAERPRAARHRSFAGAALEANSRGDAQGCRLGVAARARRNRLAVHGTSARSILD